MPVEKWFKVLEAKKNLALSEKVCDNHNSVGGPKPPDAKSDRSAVPGSQPEIMV